MDRMEKWYSMSTSEQLSNVYGDIKRCLTSDNPKNARFYFEKAINLVKIFSKDPKNSGRSVEWLDELSLLKDRLDGKNELPNDYFFRYWKQFDK